VSEKVYFWTGYSVLFFFLTMGCAISIGLAGFVCGEAIKLNQLTQAQVYGLFFSIFFFALVGVLFIDSLIEENLVLSPKEEKKMGELK